MLARVAATLVRVSGRWVPSAFAIAILLTLLTFALAMTLAGASLADCVVDWGGGVWTLLTFAMQMALIVFTGFLVAVSPPVERALKALAGVPRSPRGVIAWMGVASLTLCWLNWGLGLIGSAVLAVFLGRRHPRVDRRLLVATSYLGMGASWHAGLSGSVPLLLATPGHFLEGVTGVVPVSETLGHPLNWGVTLLAAAILVALAVVLHPREGVAPSSDLANADAASLAGVTRPARPAHPTPAERLDHGPWLNLALAALGLSYLAYGATTRGLALTLDSVNLLFLSLGVLLHRTPASLLAAAERAAGVLSGIVLQFPLYAGIYGIIKDSGLATSLTRAFVSVSTPGTFPAVVFWYSSVLNYFVPSGGSKWAIEAPYLLDAAKTLGVSTPRVAIAYAFGDMSSNLVQPFWSLPLLAVTGLRFPDILGYCLIFFLAYAALASGALLVFG